MEKREIYKQKIEAQMHEWSAKLDALKAKSEKLTLSKKVDMQRHVDALHDKLGVVKGKFDSLGEATEEQWEGVVTGLDHAWSEVKGAAEGAYDALKAHSKN